MCIRIYGLLRLESTCRAEGKLLILPIALLSPSCKARMLLAIYRGKSVMSALFGSILCLTTGSRRRFSSDLPQGGLEIPCILVIKRNAKDTMKANKLIEDALNLRKSADPSFPDSVTGREVDDCVWTKVDSIVLSRRDKVKISNGEMLDDLVINSVQVLLKKQFPDLLGLQSTLL